MLSSDMNTYILISLKKGTRGQVLKGIQYKLL